MLSLNLIAARQGHLGAGQQAGERCLAVAGNAGKAGDLAAVQRQRGIVERRGIGMARGGDVLDDQQGRADDHRRHRRRRDLLADHQRGQFLARCRSRGAFAGELARAQHQDPIADRHDFIELVRDEDDRQALADKQFQRVEQRIGLVGRQHGRRFVEDQHPGFAVERLQYFDALALADRQRGNRCIGINGQPEASGEFLDALARANPVETGTPEALRAERDVLEHRHVVGQGEVLVHHADAGIDRRAGVARPKRLAEGLDRPLVGDIMAEQDVHQRGLAGAVFAEQRDHLAALKVERDGVVGDKRSEALGDAAEAEHG